MSRSENLRNVVSHHLRELPNVALTAAVALACDEGPTALIAMIKEERRRRLPEPSMTEPSWTAPTLTDRLNSCSEER